MISLIWKLSFYGGCPPSFLKEHVVTTWQCSFHLLWQVLDWLNNHFPDAWICWKSQSIPYVMTEGRVCWAWCSHSGGYEEFCLLGYNNVHAGKNQCAVQRNMVLVAVCFMLVSCSAYSDDRVIFLWNADWFSPAYMVLYPTIYTRGIHNFSDRCCHLCSSCSSVMQQ
jgi:hypothetical protein